MAEKMWGDEEFWGLGYDWDPDRKLAVIGYIGQHQKNRLT